MLAAAIAVVLVAGVTWLMRPAPAAPASQWIQIGNTSVRIDGVQITTRQFVGLTTPMPVWLGRVPGAYPLWRAFFGQYKDAGDGLKWVFVYGTANGPVQDLEVRIDCGDYTMGPNGRQSTDNPKGFKFSTQALLGAHMPVVGVQVRVNNGDWIEAWSAK